MLTGGFHCKIENAFVCPEYKCKTDSPIKDDSGFVIRESKEPRTTLPPNRSRLLGVASSVGAVPPSHFLLYSPLHCCRCSSAGINPSFSLSFATCGMWRTYLHINANETQDGVIEESIYLGIYSLITSWQTKKMYKLSTTLYKRLTITKQISLHTVKLKS